MVAYTGEQLSTASFAFLQSLGIVGHLFQNPADSIVAHAGGGQANATQLTADMNRVITVATAGDSVALPASQAGMLVGVINAGANPMQVYGLGSDTINGVAAATGVSQMQNSVVYYSCTTAGVWQAEGIGCGYSGSFPTTSAVDGLTAHAGGGQASATPLTATLNRFTTVATIADSGLLPVSAVGMQVTVANAATNSMNVFPATGESINALAANAAFAVAGGKTAAFYCMKAGQWHSILSA